MRTQRARRVVSALALAAVAVAGVRGAGLPASETAAIDAVFADYDKPGSPGCMLGVVRDGALTYTRGYGRASLEQDVPFTADTIFDIGSTSKQFMASAILLLAADGRLSLDDDVRKYIPELPEYAAPITIRHLLTHTSGLRDYITLMTLGGWQMEDVTTPAQALDVIRRQRALDFPTGTEFAYSNTGFFLPSLIVERVSGKSLAVFARERIFEPAGMTKTRYMDDHAAVVPKRATGYDPVDGGGYRVSLSNWEQLGDGAVQTSVNELLKWDANFYTPKVGGARLVSQLQEEGRLKDGKPHGYGLGLFVGKYRGLRTVRHGGSWAGYRAELLRFPDERTSFIVLCNVATADPSTRADRVADVVLAPRFSEPAPPKDALKRSEKPPASSWAPSHEVLDTFAGVYRSEELQTEWRLEREGESLVIRDLRQPRRLLRPDTQDVFRGDGYVVTFEPHEGKAASFTVGAGRAKGMKFLRE